MRISDWSSDVCSSDLASEIAAEAGPADVVVVCPDQLGPSLDRALSGSVVESSIVPYPTAGDPRFVDWRDYEERNHPADPAPFAAAVLDPAGEVRAVGKVWNGTYRTFEAHFEAIISHLEANPYPAIVPPAAHQFALPDQLLSPRSAPRDPRP